MIHDSCTHTHIHTQGGDKVRDIADPPPHTHTHTHRGARHDQGSSKTVQAGCCSACAHAPTMNRPMAGPKPSKNSSVCPPNSSSSILREGDGGSHVTMGVKGKHEAHAVLTVGMTCRTLLSRPLLRQRTYGGQRAQCARVRCRVRWGEEAGGSGRWVVPCHAQKQGLEANER